MLLIKLAKLATPALLLPLLGGDPLADEKLERALDSVQLRHVEADIHFLASDELAGRDTPSDGLRLAARYVRARLMRLGFQPAGDNGYFDEYQLERKRLDVERTSAVFSTSGAESQLVYGKDYIFPDREIENLNLEGGLVFVGTGTKGETDGLDLMGSFALAIDSEIPWRERRANAMGTGAIGLVIVPAEDGEPFTRQYGYWAWRARSGSLTLPSSDPGGALFPQLYVDKAEVGKLVATKPAPGTVLSATMRDQRAIAEGNESFTVENVCGLWPGSDPELSKEVLIVSAHYDHVGAREGEIYNGADDNGSGSTGLLAVAEALKAHGPLRRSVMLIWVSGEEKGLLGSKAWTLDPTLPDGYVPAANINIDMIGRNAADYLLITPTEELPQYNDLVRMAEANAPKEGFPKLGSCDDYWARSDQKSFSDNLGIPVMFLFSDVHEDYHQPTDTPDKINYDKIRRVSRLVVRMLVDLQGDDLL